MNTMIFEKLIKEYDRLAYTHNYIFGYTDRGTVYAAIAKSDVLPFVCTLDRASRGCGMALRFKPTKSQKELLKSYEMFPLCSEQYFNDILNESKYNKGEIFEKLVTEYFGQKWTKDNVPFTKSGDIVINKVHYQIKYEKATFINEKTLAHLIG